VNVTWTVFANLNNGMITPIIAQMQAMLSGVCTTMQPVVLAMIVSWLGFVAFDIAIGTKSAQQAIRDFFIAAMVIGALQTAEYTQYISDFFLQAVPTTLGAAFGGNSSPVGGLDTALDLAVSAAAKTYEALPSTALKSIPLGLAIIVFVVVAIASLSFAFAVYMTATIINVAAIVIGPVFLALAAIPITRRFAAGWFGALVGGCATQLMALAVIQLLSGAETAMIRQIAKSAGTGSSNIFGMLWGLTQCGMLLMLCSAVVKKIPSIAREIAGGVYHGTAGAHAATFGVAGAAAGTAVGATRRAAAVIGAHASGQIGAGVARATSPTGPSLSRRS